MPVSIVTHSDFSSGHVTSRVDTGEVHQEDRDRISAISQACQCSNGNTADIDLFPLYSYLLDSLINRDVNQWFSVPIDPVAMGMPDYLSIVPDPIDLGTIKLEKSPTATAEELLEMMRAVFRNAKKYHAPSKNLVYIEAEQHLEWLESQIDLLRYIRTSTKMVTEIDLPGLPVAKEVHSEEYIRFLEKLENMDMEAKKVVCYSPLVMEHCDSFVAQKAEYFKQGREVSSMTRFSKDTIRVVRRALGAVLKCVELVEAGERVCSALVRPPGINGFDDQAGGCGFCIINNVCVGVANVFQKYPDAKVAIVDFDVHHGNGTQEIVQERFTDKSVFYNSIHLLEKYPEDPDNDYFPGTGEEESTSQILNIPLVPLWVKSKKRKSDERKGVEGFRRGVEMICERLSSFNPEYVFFSAGFDAAEHDEGSTYQGEIGLDVKGEDFGEATSKILSACPPEVKVVSILEGGYGRWTNRNIYDRSDLVTSYAHHIRALCNFKDNLQT